MSMTRTPTRRGRLPTTGSLESRSRFSPGTSGMGQTGRFPTCSESAAVASRGHQPRPTRHARFRPARNILKGATATLTAVALPGRIRHSMALKVLAPQVFQASAILSHSSTPEHSFRRHILPRHPFPGFVLGCSGAFVPQANARPPPGSRTEVRNGPGNSRIPPPETTIRRAPHASRSSIGPERPEGRHCQIREPRHGRGTGREMNDLAIEVRKHDRPVLLAGGSARLSVTSACNPYLATCETVQWPCRMGNNPG
jgi:hypothetical protein